MSGGKVLRTALALLAGVLLTAAPAAAKTVALVIGNSDYKTGGYLPNAANDARDAADAFRRLGHEVLLGVDLDRDGLFRIVDDFSAALSRGDTSILYYAGHAVQIGLENHIAPIDADFRNAEAMIASSLKMRALLRTMELRSKTRIVFLDACRNNPYSDNVASRSGAPVRGLARLEAGVGSFIAFATEPGAVASDGTGRNSPFTASFLKHLATPGKDLHELMRAVRADVRDATRGAQTPWENSSLLNEVTLNPAAAAPAPVASGGEADAEAPTVLASRGEPKRLHYVDGLDPNGDNFLALRTAPDGSGRRILKMPPKTRLEVLGSRGAWLNVRMEDGLEGWAHSRWIYCCVGERGAQPAAAAPPVSTPSLVGASCDQLWRARNAIWHRNGYCFRGERGRRVFGNAGCSRDAAQTEAAMSPVERAEIARIKAMETAAGCG